MGNDKKKEIYEEEKMRMDAQTKLKEEKKAKENAQGCLGCLGFIVIIVLIATLSSCFGGGNKDSKKDSESTSTAQTTQLKQNTKVYTIGLSPDEFKERFNKFSSENNLPFKVPDLTIEKGEAQDAFKVIFSDNLALNGTVNKKDGSLRDILIIGQPTKNAADNINIILAFGTAIVAVNPELTPDERGQLLKGCGLAGENLDFANLDKSAVRNNIKYHATFTEGIGFMFTISSVDDK